METNKLNEVNKQFSSNQKDKSIWLKLKNEYEDFIKVLEEKMEIDENWFDAINSILQYVETKYKELNKSYATFINSDKYENSSKSIKEYSNYLKKSKIKYDKKSKDLNEHFAFLNWVKKVSDRDKLYRAAKNELVGLNENYLVTKDKLENLINDANQLNELISDKNSLINEIEVISNNLSENLGIISDLINQVDKFGLVESNYMGVIEDSIREINKIYDTFKNISWPNYESKINELKESCDRAINEEMILGSSQEVKKLLSEFEHSLKNPFLTHDLRKFDLADDEFESIKQNIINDIINQKIVGENIDFKAILISYCEEYTKLKNTLSNEELDEILSTIDLKNVEKPIIDETKYQVKKDYEDGKLTKNMIPIKFKKLLDKKFDELEQLKLLEEIKNNPSVPNLKQYLSEEDCIIIYDKTEKKICSEYGLRGSVLSFVETEMYRKNEKNKSEAREEFKRYRFNMKYFIELTNLRDSQVESFVREVEVLIGDNKIKTNDFDEEFIQQLSLSFKNYGRIIL